MNDYTMQVLAQLKGQGETYLLQEIERAANEISDKRKAMARFLEDYPEMEEFWSGDVINGYEYVPRKVSVATEELLESMETTTGFPGMNCIPVVELGVNGS